MSNERKPIPYWCDNVFRECKRGYVNQYGMYRSSACESHVAYESYDVLTQAPYYYDVEDGCLTINIVKVDSEFFAEEVGKFWINQYDELEGTSSLDIFSPYGVCLNNSAIISYLMPVFCRQSYYEEIMVRVEDDIKRIMPIDLLKIFLTKKHKIIPFLIQNDRIDAVKAIIRGYGEGFERLTKKEITLTNEWDIKLESAIKLCERYNPQEVSRFCSMISHFRINVHDTMEFIANHLNIEDFTGFANYFLKNIILYGAVDVGGEFHTSTCGNFLVRYRDYLNMTDNEENRDLYPEDISAAHDAAVERHYYADGEVKYDVDAFKKAVSLYKYLECSVNQEIHVVAPESPEDLIKEGQVMHHCVKSYIDSVIKGATVIMLARKDGKPYLTFEIRNKHIIQAKKRFNELPNDDDILWIKKYADSVGLKIKHY